LAQAHENASRDPRLPGTRRNHVRAGRPGAQALAWDPNSSNDIAAQYLRRKRMLQRILFQFRGRREII
jgi:hypothetical protein